MTKLNSEKIGIISVDGHVKAPWQNYRDYLDPQWREPYDEWLAGRSQKSDFVLAELGEDAQWSAARRINDLAAEGVVAELLFSNGIPFDHQSGIHAVNAGYTAYNRWIADICAPTNGRMLPQAHIDFTNIPAAVGEIHAAKNAGFAGILMPPLTAGSRYFFDPALDPIWAACVETGLPISQHGGVGAPRYEPESAAAFLVLAAEHSFFSGRSLWQLILGGVFDRFPGLNVVYVETETWWLRPIMRILDRRDRVGDEWAEAAKAAGRNSNRPYKKLPSEYLHTNIFMGISPCVKSTVVEEFDASSDHPLITPQNAMLGVDYPHPETALREVKAAINALATLPSISPDDVRNVAFHNAVRVYGLDTEKLKTDVEKIGFELA